MAPGSPTEQAEAFKHFSEEGRRILLLAQVEARLLAHPHVGPEHLLLGIVHHSEGVAAIALAELGVTLGTARQAVEQLIGTPVASDEAEYPMFTEPAKDTLLSSRREADELGQEHIGPEHLLLALVRQHAGPAVDVLLRLGAEPGEVRSRVIARLQAPSAGPALGAVGTAS